MNVSQLCIAFSGMLSSVLSASAATVYVDVNSTNPIPPYANWAAAANVIQDAVNAANPGDTVLVTNGVYGAGGTSLGRVVVNKALKLQSVNGPQFTTIIGNKVQFLRCVYLASGASLSGFTLTEGTGGGRPWSGGGVLCESTNSVVSNCVLAGNSASQGGGAYSGTLNGCMLTGNSAGEGGGAARSILNNCTLTGNFSDSGGGASSSTLNNCVVYFNEASISGDNYFGGNLNHCCTTPLPTGGTGNIGLDPLLASTSHLSADSPCRAAGSAAYTTGTDIDGELWASPPSIGCDEYWTGSVTGALSVAMEASYTNVAPGITVDFAAHISGRTTGSVWAFGDGTVVSNQPYASHAWAAAGDYPVVLRAYNESWPGGVSATVTVQVVENPMHYVAADGANPTPPYMSWSTAATNIQDAVDAAFPGGTVLVTNGLYASGGKAIDGIMANRVAVYKPLVVRSVNGPEYTVIDGAGLVRCVYLTNHTLLAGFTLTNGTGGIKCESLSVVVSNCVLTGNFAAGSESYGGGAYSGTLKNCSLSGNSAYFGGGAAFSTLNHCTLTGNSAAFGGGGSYYGTLNNCTLTRNSGGFWGGGSFDGVLNNCILTGNSARDGGGSSDGTLNNCKLTGNSAGIAGGGSYYGTLNNCTVAGNSAYLGGGSSRSTFNNCIVYFNTDSYGANNFFQGYFPEGVNYCCTTPLPYGGTGNITNAPLFLDTNRWSDLRLQSNSSCIDAGNNDFVTSLTDLDGNPRIIDGIVDMGAYEFVPPAPDELVEQLIALVSESDLQHKQPLLASLEAALASLQRGSSISAENQLRAFQNKVRAQVHPFDPVFEMELVEAAGRVIEALGGEESTRGPLELHFFMRQSNGKMQVKIDTLVGKVHIVEASTNLVDWEAVGVATDRGDGTYEFEDVGAAKHACRFYRFVVPE